MRFCIATLLLILRFGLFGQTIDSLGLDNNARLTKYESEYFNNEFKDWRKEFDFTDKKVAFITGSSASKHQTKTHYFKEVTDRLKHNLKMSHSPVFLTQEEKIESGDYDVIVLYWVKVMTDKRRRKIIDELKAASR